MMTAILNNDGLVYIIICMSLLTNEGCYSLSTKKGIPLLINYYKYFLYNAQVINLNHIFYDLSLSFQENLIGNL